MPNDNHNAQMESYPPTLEDLRKSFLALHPGYEFGVAIRSTVHPYNPITYAPLEPVGGIDTQGNKILAPRPTCHSNGVRCWEWIWYIYERAKAIAQEAGVGLPPDGQYSNDPYRRLYIAETMYWELCNKNKVVTAEAYRGRQQERERTIQMKKNAEEKYERDLLLAKEWQAKGNIMVNEIPQWGKNGSLINAYHRAMTKEQRLSKVSDKAKITKEEAEAVIAHLSSSSDGFKKDTLLALKALNRFANENGIRVEDAVVVIREYA